MKLIQNKFFHLPSSWLFMSSLSGVYIEPVFLSLWLVKDFFASRLFPSKIPLYMLAVLFHGLIMTYFAGYNIKMFLSQCLLLFITLLGYNQIFKRTGSDVRFWFDQYLRFAVFIAIIGIVDLIYYYIFGSPLLTKTLDMKELSSVLRLKACLLEPGYVTTFLTPAVVYVFLSVSFFKNNKFKSMILVTALILTFSTSLIFVFAIILYFKFRKKFQRHSLLITLLFFVFSFYLYGVIKNQDLEGKDNTTAVNKLVETLNVSTSATPYEFEMLNASSYSQLTNMWIAFHAPFRLVGTGLGTHSQNYESLYQSNFYLYGLNSKDAYSIFSRVLSEFGIIGILIYVYFLYRFFNKKSLYSICFLTAIIGAFIRGGNYTVYCIALFHYLYYQCRFLKNNLNSDNYEGN